MWCPAKALGAEITAIAFQNLPAFQLLASSDVSPLLPPALPSCQVHAMPPRFAVITLHHLSGENSRPTPTPDGRKTRKRKSATWS